ncbi:hypothetical protein GCM10010123_05750 [Pilimelia anulata]|uniref:Chitin-binding type-4 domain-containing protein n=1 Tax=Pilimelia anulata TaxID=53371 RepID=A0A8J3F8I5_9ACTN|nr:lytic polysaccharide monooxygenase auxiliary activity family 9 protein [Pilimelia anulata]GGJ78660.1 hypothetical protein GCM10010123_05750 [Pilimelia anulata]
MRRRILLPLLTTAAVVVSLFVAVPPALAHGYVLTPPSRQANCASKAMAGCGDIVWEPQSVEAPKGAMSCNGNGARFAELNDDSRPWPAAKVGQQATFTWKITARHATTTWEYFIGGKRIAVFDDKGKPAQATMTHHVSLAGYTGRQKVLARWNIADTVNAFYNCVDLDVSAEAGIAAAPVPVDAGAPAAGCAAHPAPAAPVAAAEHAHHH